MSKQQIIRGILAHCQICNKKYNILHKQHICKRCLRSTCSDCTEQKQPIFQKKQQKRKPHRLCKVCKPQVDFLENYLSHYKLKFNTTCKVGKEWGQKLAKLNSGVVHPPQYQKPKKDTLRTRNEIWNSFTFSYRNFVGLLIMDIDYHTPLRYVYDKCSYGNCSEYLILFLLCHCDQTTTLDLLNNLQCVLAQHPPSRNAIYQNLQYLGCNSSQIHSLKYYIQYKFPTFMRDLSLNHLTVQLSLFVISGVMSQKKPRNSLEKCFSIYIFVIREIIQKNGIEFGKIEGEALQVVRAQDFETNMRVLLQKQKLQEQAKRLRDESKSLKQTLDQQMRMSYDRNSSVTSQDRSMWRNSSQVSREEMEELGIVEEEGEGEKERKKSQEFGKGGSELNVLVNKMKSISKQLDKDMSQIQRLSKQLLDCLND